MKISEINKILVVSDCVKFTKNIGKQLSQSLGMMFCDVDDLVEYELIDKDKIKEICSADYLKDREKKVMQHFASFENVVGSVDAAYFLKNSKILKKNTLVVFVKLPKSFVDCNASEIEKLSQTDRETRLQSLANATVVVRKTDDKFVCEKIIETLRGLL